jgi:aminopeptidase N
MNRGLAGFIAGVIMTPLAGVAQEPAPEAFHSLNEKLHVVIDFEDQRLTGSISFDMENWTKQPARSVSLILHRLMLVTAVRDGSGTPLQFTQDVVRFTDQPMRQVTQLRVTLSKAVPPAGRTTVRIDYSGYLTPYSEIGWLYVRDHIDTAFTILRRDALAFPEIAGVSRTANRRMPRSEFTYTADVVVPNGFVVAAGGTSSRASNSDSTVTWRYVTNKPSPFLNISIARFDTLQAGGVRIFYFPADSSGARYLAQRAQDGIRLLTMWFGPLHDEPRLTIAEIPDGWGSQANLVAGIIQTASAFRDTMQVGQLYHELTHLWNAVERDTAPPRWNEGLASFLQGLMQEQLNRWPGRKVREQQRIADLKKDVSGDSLLRTVPLTMYGAHEMTGRSYTVGNIMFSAFYDLVGETDFNKTIGGYYQQFPNGGTTSDFVAFAKKNTTHDVSKFFDDWFFSTRWNDVIASSNSVSDIVGHYTKNR